MAKFIFFSFINLCISYGTVLLIYIYNCNLRININHIINIRKMLVGINQILPNTHISSSNNHWSTLS